MTRRLPFAWVIALALAGCGGPATGTPGPSYSIDCRAADAMDLAHQSPGPVQYSTMVVDDRLRDYRVYQPPGLDASKPAPAVIALHGSPQDAAAFEDIIHFQAKAKAADFLAIYPDGCYEDWDSSAGSYDVHFVASLIDRLATTGRIDKARVYAVGVSAGGKMTHRLGCDLSARLAAVVVVAGVLPVGDCTPARPLPIMIMHGTEDGIDRAVEAVDKWVALDQCSGAPTVTRSGITQTSIWAHCQTGAVVQFESVEGGHHTWFGSQFNPVPGEPDANTDAWAFMQQFRLSG